MANSRYFLFPAEDETVCIRKNMIENLTRASCNSHSDFYMKMTDILHNASKISSWKNYKVLMMICWMNTSTHLRILKNLTNREFWAMERK